MADASLPPPQPSDAAMAVAAAEQALRQGEPLLAYNAVQDGLQAHAGNLRLRQLGALALARSGDTERANRLLRELAEEGVADAETSGMLARTHKDLGLAARDPHRRRIHLAAAFEIYHEAYQAARERGAAADAWYTGINAATVAVLEGDLPAARQIAAAVRTLCLARSSSLEPEAGADSAGEYWRAATLGEAALILGDVDDAAGHYRRAASLAAARYGNLSSTRSQAELLIERLPTSASAPGLVEILRIPPILMYTGHMIDLPGRAERRFPVALAAAAAAAVRERFARLQPMAVYGSAACGTDILCLEAMREIGGETHIVLPFPPAEFHRVSVDFAPGGWRERFERVIAAADSVTITSEHRARGSSATFEYANLVLTGMARLRAAGLKTALRGVTIWDEKPPSGAGGAASLVDMWRGQGIALELIRLSDIERRAAASPAPPAAVLPPSGYDAISPNERTPPGFTHEIRAMLFADAVGYSGLSEDQTPHFVTEFLGAVAALRARSSAPPEHVETTGDGLYMVFGDVRAAALFALDLDELVAGTDWSARGLPDGLNLRIALHCGPVYCGRNPLTGAALYTGPHTSRTARIEPVTPPGQVYASSAFAAVAAAHGIDEFKLLYVGRLPLAKGYGLLGLYHLSRGPVTAPTSSANSAAAYSGPVGPA
jgi:hypothetical protein